MEEWSFIYSSRTDLACFNSHLAQSLLWLNIPFIRSGTCEPTECHGDIETSQFHILICLLLDLIVELGSFGCRCHSHDRP